MLVHYHRLAAPNGAGVALEKVTHGYWVTGSPASATR